MTGAEILNGVWSHAPEVGVIFGAAIATYIAKIKGLVHFGKSVSDRRSCPSRVITEVSRICGSHQGMEDSIKALSIQLEKIDEKVDTMGTDLSNIAGYLQGKNGYHS